MSRHVMWCYILTLQDITFDQMMSHNRAYHNIISHQISIRAWCWCCRYSASNITVRDTSRHHITSNAIVTLNYSRSGSPMLQYHHTDRSLWLVIILGILLGIQTTTSATIPSYSQLQCGIHKSFDNFYAQNVIYSVMYYLKYDAMVM